MDLLLATLAEHERLLWELEHPLEESHSGASLDHTQRLHLVKAQILLFERLLIGKKIDALALLVNHYADILSTLQVAP